MKQKTFNVIKTFLFVLIVGAGVIWLICLNVREFSKQDVIQKTDSDITYFTNFTMKTTDGGEFSTLDLADYNYTIINGWGPYCNSCINEMPELEILSNEYKEKGVHIIGLIADNYEDEYDLDLAYDAIESTGVTYTILIGDDIYRQEVYPMLNDSLPGTWVLDNNGNLVEFIAGAKSEAQWREIFDKYVEG